MCVLCCSGNRDEAVFDRPAEFHGSRPKNRHVGFGGGGPHLCIDAGLARTQLRAEPGSVKWKILPVSVISVAGDDSEGAMGA